MCNGIHFHKVLLFVNHSLISQMMMKLHLLS